MALLAALMPLTACSPGSGGTTLSAQEEASIAQGVGQILSAKQYRPGVSGGTYFCSQYFTVGEPKVLDASLSGDTGKVRVSVPVTALAPEDLGPLYAPSSRYQYPVQYCYGYPSGGWSQGQTANSVYIASVQRWGSGWQLSSTEPLTQE